MEEFYLARPAWGHQAQYEEMMDEWEAYGGRLNPGALRRYSKTLQKNVTYDKWLQWVEEDRQSGQDLYFFMEGDRILGAISIRFGRKIGTEGHSGYGIRPSCRGKGYGAKMLAMALPVMREYGINPVMISCDKENIGSAKTIKKNGGYLIEEVMEDGIMMQVYQIDQK